MLKWLLRLAPVRRLMYLHCGDSARLITARLDGPLPPWQRLKLARHLLLCAACPRFVQQMALMERALKRWRGYTERADDD